jgi:hypothetical protein
MRSKDTTKEGRGKGKRLHRHSDDPQCQINASRRSASIRTYLQSKRRNVLDEQCVLKVAIISCQICNFPNKDVGMNKKEAEIGISEKENGNFF